MNSYGFRPPGSSPEPVKTSSYMGAWVYPGGYGGVNLSLQDSIRPLWLEEEDFEVFEEEFGGEEFNEDDDFYELVEYIDNQRW